MRNKIISDINIERDAYDDCIYQIKLVVGCSNELIK